MPAPYGAAPRPCLTLVIPGLLGPLPAYAQAPMAPPLDALESVLARAERLKGDRRQRGMAAYEADIARLFGLAADGGALPVAALTRLADGGQADDRWWLRADPINLQAAGGGLILTDATGLRITAAEAERLAQEIMETYAEDGWQLEVRSPLRWYLSTPAAAQFSAPSPMALAGRDIQDHLPEGDDAKAWHTTLNEVQILLHTSGINSEREARGLPSVNSLWFWGGGRLPALAAAGWERIWAQEPMVIGMAMLAQCPLAVCPATAADWLVENSAPGNYLVVLESLRAAAAYCDVEAWSAAVAAMDSAWMAPLAGAVRAGDLAELTIVGDGRGFRYTRAATRRWWRRRQRLDHYR